MAEKMEDREEEDRREDRGRMAGEDGWRMEGRTTGGKKDSREGQRGGCSQARSQCGSLGHRQRDGPPETSSRPYTGKGP